MQDLNYLVLISKWRGQATLVPIWPGYNPVMWSCDVSFFLFYYYQHGGRYAHGSGTEFNTVMMGRPEEVPPPATDYYKLTFVLLILCTLHLNLPAILMLLTALFFSVKVKQYIKKSLVEVKLVCLL